MNKQRKQHRIGMYHRNSTGRKHKKSLEELKHSLRRRHISTDQADYEELDLPNKPRFDNSYNFGDSTKLLEDHHFEDKFFNHDDVNSRRLKLNDTANERYQACDINSNMFNIYEYHNSFTASSVLKHSFNTHHKDRLNHEDPMLQPLLRVNFFDT